MVYLIYGLDDYLINSHIKQIADCNRIITYDLVDSALNDIINDADTISMFDSKKVIVVENSYIFTRTTKIKNEQPIEILEKYLNNINSNTILIFVVRSEKIDSVKKIVKMITKYGKIIECNKVANITEFVKNKFQGYQITSQDIDFLIKRVGIDLGILAQEIEKIKAYKMEDKTIDRDSIEALTEESIDTDIFAFIDNIINKNKNQALTTYYELLECGEEPIKIIIMLANKFRLMYQVRVLNNNRMTTGSIAQELGVHEYPVKLALEASSKYDLNILLSLLKKLAVLDENIKTGQMEAKLGLELFIINM